MDTKILRGWLRAGYLDKGMMYPTLRGTPQGGIISPVLMNMTLDGLEGVARSSVPTRHSKEMGGIRPAVNVIRYADDFAITASYQATVEGFARRGLSRTQALALIATAVHLAQAARDTFWEKPANRMNRVRPLVAGSVGPYGAYLADGSEYRGAYNLTVNELIAFHRQS